MISELAKRWIEYYSSKDNSLLWASEELNDLCHEYPEKGWKVILEISSLTDDPRVLGNLAAGPLEELLCTHGAQFIERFEVHTRQNPEFVPVTKGIWIKGAPKDIEERVHAIQAKYL